MAVREKSVMQANRRRWNCPSMLARPARRVVADGRRFEKVHFAGNPREIGIDTLRSLQRCAREHIADHKTEGVVVPVFSSPESVDAFHHILPTKMRIRTGDTLAFDDRMRIMFACSPEFRDQDKGDVGSTIRNQNSFVGS